MQPMGADFPTHAAMTGQPRWQRRRSYSAATVTVLHPLDALQGEKRHSRSGMDRELIAFLSLLATNAVIGIVCRLAAPRRWASRLCLATLGVNALLLVLLLAVVLRGCRETMRHEADPMFGLLLLPGALVLLEFLGLCHIYDARFRRKQSPPPGSP